MRANLQRARGRIAGLVLVALTLGLVGVAYGLYQTGLPGSPRIENQIRIGTTLLDRSRIAAMVPPGTSVETSVEYQLGKDEKEGHRAHVFVHVNAPSRVQYVGLYLGGDAASETVEVNPPLYQKNARIVRTVRTRYAIHVPQLDSLYDSQLVFIQLLQPKSPPREDGPFVTTFGLDIVTRAPVIARENARIAVVTPRSTKALACSLLTGLENDAPLQQPALKRPQDLGCIQVRDGHSSVQHVSLSLPAFEVRIDSLYPEPSEAGRLSWRGKDDLAVHGSIVSIDEEARGQRYLFLAGIAAGLAVGLAPLIIERLLPNRSAGPQSNQGR